MATSTVKALLAALTPTSNIPPPADILYFATTPSVTSTLKPTTYSYVQSPATPVYYSNPSKVNTKYVATLNEQTVVKASATATASVGPIQIVAPAAYVTANVEQQVQVATPQVVAPKVIQVVGRPTVQMVHPAQMATIAPLPVTAVATVTGITAAPALAVVPPTVAPVSFQADVPQVRVLSGMKGPWASHLAVAATSSGREQKAHNVLKAVVHKSPETVAREFDQAFKTIKVIQNGGVRHGAWAITHGPFNEQGKASTIVKASNTAKTAAELGLRDGPVRGKNEHRDRSGFVAKNDRSKPISNGDTEDHQSSSQYTDPVITFPRPAGTRWRRRFHTMSPDVDANAYVHTIVAAQQESFLPVQKTVKTTTHSVSASEGGAMMETETGKEKAVALGPAPLEGLVSGKAESEPLSSGPAAVGVAEVGSAPDGRTVLEAKAQDLLSDWTELMRRNLNEVSGRHPELLSTPIENFDTAQRMLENTQTMLEETKTFVADLRGLAEQAQVNGDAAQ